MPTLDWIVMGVYFALVIAIGARFARKPSDPASYFLGKGEIPWWAVMLSIVATETSALTVISVPGLALRGDLTFLQLAFGYLIGRIGVSLWLLPGYFRGEQLTAYARLETRFGPATRRSAALVFMGIRAMGDSVRVFATAIPLAIVSGWSSSTSVAVVMVVTLLYTVSGGLRAVVWLDVLQLAIYTLGGVATLLVAAEIAGGLGEALQAAAEAGKLRTIDLSLSWSAPYTLAGGIVGGALLSAASHGTDHLIVQRVLATGGLGAARKAMIGSGFLVIVQFALFLLVGTLLWAAGADEAGVSSDRIYPRFVVERLPAGVSGLVVAGLLAAAMSTVSSSLNSLASATTHDLFSPLRGERRPEKLLAFGRWATLGWALVLGAGALAFRSDQPVVELALTIASISYGGLLGAYLLASAKRVHQFDVLVAIATSVGSMLTIWLLKPGALGELAMPWYVPLGLAIALTVGLASSRLRSEKGAEVA